MSKKKILLLGDINSVHLQKWINSLCDVETLYVFSLDPLVESNSFGENRIKFELCTNSKFTTSSSVKLTYLKSYFKLKKFYDKCNPDIVHAHYATSYGLLGSLLNPKKFFISVWGSDIYQFPKKSIIHSLIFKKILSKAINIFSTSESMKVALKRYTNQEVLVLPFGIDINMFRRHELPSTGKEFCIGTVKALEPVYRIDLLIKGFTLFRSKNNNGKCYIHGKGYLKSDLQQLIESLGMSEHIILKGWTNHDDVPEVLNSFDVFCAFSERESFGVSVIEASSCELPVVVSDAEGFKEVVKHKETGIIINNVTPETIADTLEYIYKNPDAAHRLGQSGRLMVASKYNWVDNVQKQLKYYNSDL